MRQPREQLPRIADDCRAGQWRAGGGRENLREVARHVSGGGSGRVAVAVAVGRVVVAGLQLAGGRWQGGRVAKWQKWQSGMWQSGRVAKWYVARWQSGKVAKWQSGRVAKWYVAKWHVAKCQNGR
jgi:hypothetical protein